MRNEIDVPASLKFPVPAETWEQRILKNLATNQILLERIVAAIRNAATDVPVWHVDECQRWELFRDTLLGTLPLRGFQRPRDYPMDEEAREVISLAESIGSLVVTRIPKKYVGSYPGPVRFTAWLTLFAILVSKTAENESWSRQAKGTEPSPYRLALWTALAMLRRAHGLKIPKGTDPQTTDTDTLLSALGANRQEFRKQKLQGPLRDRVREMAGQAMIGAGWLMQRGPEDDLPVDFTNIPESQRSCLAGIPCTLAVVATAKAQSYIAEAGEDRLARGASAWCTQALALVRNKLASKPGWLLLSDSDAVCMFAIPDHWDAMSIRECLEHWMRENLRDVLKRSLPRLAHAIQAEEVTVPMLAASMPQFKLKVLKGSLEEACRFGCVRENVPEECTASHPTNNLRPFTEAPPWWENKLKEPLDWNRLLWSLAGASYRQHILQGLSTFVGGAPWSEGSSCVLQAAACIRRPHAAVHHGDWLRQLGCDHEPLALIKIDGDHVGARFGSLAPLNRPSEGISLSMTVLQRLRRGILEVETEMKLRDDQPHPVDIQYLGGDDVLAFLPRSQIPAFCKGFAREVEPGEGDPVVFTGICLTLPVQPQQEKKAELNSLAHRMIGCLLEIAKGIHAGDPDREDKGRQALLERTGAQTLMGINIGERALYSSGTLWITEARMEML